MKIIGFAFLLFITGCNANNKPWTAPPPELQEFEHFYNVSFETDAEANVWFRLIHPDYPGIVHQLSEGFEVYFDDHALNYEEDYNQSRYITNLKSQEVLGIHVWRINYNGRTVLEFPVKSERLKLINEIPDTLIGKRDLKLIFDGVEDGDIIRMYFNGDYDSRSNFEYKVRNKSVTISSADIRSLKNQRFKLSITSWKTTSILYNNEVVGNSSTNFSIEDRYITVAHK